jgi:hypothetical protein
MKRLSYFLTSLLLAITLTACRNSTPTAEISLPTVTVAAAALPSPTPAFTPTAMPSVTPPRPTATLQPTLTPTPGQVWATIESTDYRVSLQIPASWEPVKGYEDRYGDKEGFVQLSAMGGQGLTLAESCDSEANQQLRPYGSKPAITLLSVLNQPACRITPSADQAADMSRQAALIVQYPQAVQISGDTYLFFIMWADEPHLAGLAQSLQWQPAN